MIFDQAMSIYEIMSSNINFNLSLLTYLTRNVSVFLLSKLVLKEKKWLFFLFISLWENTLLWKKSQRNNKTQSTTVQIYTFWSWKERLEKAVTNQNKPAVPLTNQEQNKTRRECVTWLVGVSRSWHGMYVIAECFKFWLAHCAGCVCCDWLFHHRD